MIFGKGKPIINKKQDDKKTIRPEPDSNRRMTVLQTVALANLAIGP